jgi:UDP-N-acetylglucosamine:LPS N-acetylglucosamine transferase
MPINKRQIEEARKYFELEQILLRTNPQMRDILIKANDGRGRGHIGRVANFITYKLIKDRIDIIVNRDFTNMVPEGVVPIGVADQGFRIDLDPYFNGAGIPKKYQKFIQINKDGKPQLCNCIDQAIADYYCKIMSSITKDTKLIYIDDQNSPETLFMNIVGKFIGINFKDMKEMAKHTGLAIEMETQDVFRESMWQAYKKTRYIHLSSAMEFMKAASKGGFSLRGLEDKVIPMGFPLSDKNKAKLDIEDRIRESYKNNLINEYSNNCNEFFYCTFGGGDGAEEVGKVICEAAEVLDKIMISISDTTGKIKQNLESQGYSATKTDKEAYRISNKQGKEMNVYLNLKINNDHLTTLACADLILTAAGSGGTYEAIRTCNPMIILPLPRPGFEQDYKSAGVKNMGFGEIMLLEEEQTSDIINFYNECSIKYGKDIRPFTKSDLISLTTTMLSNKKKYTNINLSQREPLFGTEEIIGQTIYLMAEHLEPGEIRYYLDLTSLR